jgi:hypothetical protein
MPRDVGRSLANQQPENILDTICAFVNKIVFTIIRARSSQLDLLDLSLLTSLSDFWRHGLPINVDIFHKSSRQLLERWTLSFESR